MSLNLYDKFYKSENPEEKMDKYLKTLELDEIKEINIGRNKLTKIPDIIFKMTNLESLAGIQNDFTEIPEKISNLKKLKIIQLADNKINKISSFNELNHLTEIFLDNNQIENLNFLENCRLENLKQLNLTNNPRNKSCLSYNRQYVWSTTHEGKHSVEKLLEEINKSSPDIPNETLSNKKHSSSKYTKTKSKKLSKLPNNYTIKTYEVLPPIARNIIKGGKHHNRTRRRRKMKRTIKKHKQMIRKSKKKHRY